MAGRIRTIKPEILEDENAAALSSDAWRLWVSMWLICDDFGRLRGDSRRLAASIFWACPHHIDINGVLEELSTNGRIVRYQVRGQQYIEIANWAKHQRIDNASKTFKLPGPEEKDSEQSAATRGEPPRTSAIRGSEKEKEGDKEKERKGEESPLSRARVMGEAWSGAGLPGMPGGYELGELVADLDGLKLDPEAACTAFKSLLDAWKSKRGVLVKPVPAKMREHLPFVQQILAGELSLADIGRQPNGHKRTEDSRPQPAIFTGHKFRDEA